MSFDCICEHHKKGEKYCYNCQIFGCKNKDGFIWYEKAWD